MKTRIYAAPAVKGLPSCRLHCQPIWHWTCAGSIPQQTQEADPMLGEWWVSVTDSGPTLSQHWISIFCILLYCVYVGLILGHRPGQHWTKIDIMFLPCVDLPDVIQLNANPSQLSSLKEIILGYISPILFNMRSTWQTWGAFVYPWSRSRNWRPLV